MVRPVLHSYFFKVAPYSYPLALHSAPFSLKEVNQALSVFPVENCRIVLHYSKDYFLSSLLCKIFNLNSLSKFMDSLVRVGSKILFGVELCIGVCIVRSG